MSEEIVFGIRGWRGELGKQFSKKTVNYISQAVCNYLYEKHLAQKGCVVGYDTRVESEDYALAIADTLQKNGIAALKVENFCPTPQTAYAVSKVGAAAGIMVTGCDLPAGHNGIYLIPDYAGPASLDILEELEWEIGKVVDLGQLEPPPGRTIGPLRKIDVSNDYIRHLFGMVEKSIIERSRIRVLFDPMFGAGQNIFMRTLYHMDCIVVPLHSYLNPELCGICPDPFGKDVAECRKAVLDNKADIGVALDGDGCKFSVVDSRGVLLDTNQMLTLLLWYMLTYKPTGGTVARTMANAHILDDIAEQNGCRVIETPPGFMNVSEVMRNKMIILGCDEEGGVSVADHIPQNDGVLGGLICVEIAARFKKPLSELLSGIYREFGPCYTDSVEFTMPRERIEETIERLQGSPPRKIGDEKVVKVDMRDGVKLVTEEQTWVYVHPVRHEPLVRVYFEGRSEESFEKARDAALKVVKSK